MIHAKSFLLAAMLLIMTVEPISAIGIGESAPYWGSGSKEYYCAAHGGNPQGGNCYFPDGSYCDLGSFYNGTCPGRGYYEQAAWMAEAYRFLDGDEAYYSPYISNQGAATPYGYSYSYMACPVELLAIQPTAIRSGHARSDPNDQSTRCLSVLHNRCRRHRMGPGQDHEPERCADPHGQHNSGWTLDLCSQQ